MSGMVALESGAVTGMFARYVGRGLLVFTVCQTAAHGEPVSFKVTDAAGQPVTDAVVYAEPTAPMGLPRAPIQTVIVEQRARQFIPLVSVVQTGTPVSFPNNDKVRHQVYSFSPAKTFELKLYAGVPAQPIIFDRSGTVVIGCNIHDKMITYMHVVDTPYFAKTDSAGNAVLDGLPAGSYVIKTWHYASPASAPIVEQPLRVAAAPANVNIKINIDANAVIK